HVPNLGTDCDSWLRDCQVRPFPGSVVPDGSNDSKFPPSAMTEPGKFGPGACLFIRTVRQLTVNCGCPAKCF
ncbi:unnamed protein product, partial [Rotaria socialis]